MSNFCYRALDANGSLQQGELNAAHIQQARSILQGKSWRVLSVDEAKSSHSPLFKGKLPRLSPGLAATTKAINLPASTSAVHHLKEQDILIFSEELADLLKGGLQINLALNAMSKRSANPKIQLLSSQLLALVEDGVSLSKACQKVSSSFDHLFINLIFAGENSGALDAILERHVIYMKSIHTLKNKIKIASIYPMILVLLVIGISILFSVVLAPMLIELITTMPGASKQLPFGIEVMLGAEYFFKQWGWLLAALIIASMIIFQTWKKKPENQLVWDNYVWNMRYLGPIIQSNFYVYFLSTIQNLLANGLPLLKALELGSNTTVNLYARQQLSQICEDVAQGRSLSSALNKSQFFPATLVDMISIGEQIGKLNKAIERSAERYEKDLNQKLTKLMAIIPPIIMVIMTFVIGGFLYVMFTAIFSSIGQMSG